MEQQCGRTRDNALCPKRPHTPHSFRFRAITDGLQQPWPQDGGLAAPIRPLHQVDIREKGWNAVLSLDVRELDIRTQREHLHTLGALSRLVCLDHGGSCREHHIAEVKVRDLQLVGWRKNSRQTNHVGAGIERIQR